MDKKTTITSRIEEELKDFLSASLGTKILVIIFVLSSLWIGYREIFKIPLLKSEILNSTKEIHRKDLEIQKLETQLTPFKTIALEKYTGSEQEKLQKLVERIKQLEDPLKKEIVSATAHVEITIKSDENVFTRYMGEGGYLAFMKNRQPYLLTADTQSNAKQTGKGVVIYSGVFQIVPDQSAIGELIETLKTSNLIEIMFEKIPENSYVLSGKTAITINNEVRLEFEILPQQTQGMKIFIKDVLAGFQKYEQKNKARISPGLGS